MDQFRFAHPDLLYLFALIPIAILLYCICHASKKRNLRKFGEMPIISQLMPNVSFVRPAYKFAILALALFFIIIGIAGPQFGSKLQKVKRKGVEIMIALDVSNSMMAQDIKPNRLERAKRAISQMTDKLNNDKLGLIVFAGDAYTQLPITTDYASAKLFLSSISTEIVPIQGTAIGAAIDLATRSFTPDSEAGKAIVVITDGENHQDDAVSAAKAAKEMGIVVHTIAMGSPQGAPIPVRSGSSDFRKDAQGNVVISKLNRKLVEEVAAAGGGKTAIAGNASTGLNLLFKEINKMDKTDLDAKVYTAYNEKFQVFLAIGLLLILLEFLILERKNKYLKKWNLFA